MWAGERSSRAIRTRTRPGMRCSTRARTRPSAAPPWAVMPLLRLRGAALRDDRPGLRLAVLLPLVPRLGDDVLGPLVRLGARLLQPFGRRHPGGHHTDGRRPERTDEGST